MLCVNRLLGYVRPLRPDLCNTASSRVPTARALVVGNVYTGKHPNPSTEYQDFSITSGVDGRVLWRTIGLVPALRPTNASTLVPSRRSLSTSARKGGDPTVVDAPVVPVTPSSTPSESGSPPIGDDCSTIPGIDQTEVLLGAQPVDMGFAPSELAMRVVDWVHVTGGLPYWAAIGCITLALRSIIFPVGLLSIRNSSRLAIMKPEMDLLKASIEDDPNSSQVRRADRYRQEMRALFRKHKCNMMNGIAFPLVQIPLFISFFTGLRSMAETFPAYASGGTLWFMDLGAADPTHAFPILTGLTFLLMAEVGADGMAQGSNSSSMRAGMRGLSVVMVPLTWNVSSGVFVYWLTSNMYSLAQTLFLKAPKIKSALDIPTARPPPPPLDKSMTWMGVLGAKNPFQAYNEMRHQQEMETWLAPPIGGSPGSPLPRASPRPPLEIVKAPQPTRAPVEVVTYAERPTAVRTERKSRSGRSEKKGKRAKDREAGR